MINLAIMFIIIVIMYAILVQFKQEETKIGLDQIPAATGSILRRVWRAISIALLSSLLTFVISILLFLWVLWRIIKAVVPNFPIPFKLILLKIPPFPDLERARIFALFDGIFGLMFSRSTLGRRLTNFGYIIKDFLQVNSAMLFNELKGKAGGGGVAEPSDAGGGGNFTGAERQLINNQMQQCIKEKSVQVTPDMDKATVAKTNATNLQAKLTCQLDQLKTTSNLLALKT
jgi:hypothetical protein